MLKKINLLIASVFAFGLMLVPATTFAGADIKGGLCQGATNLEFSGTNSAACDANADEGQLNDLIRRVINIVSVIVAIVAVIMIIVGGFKYIASGGDSTKVTSAKNTILYAIIGLVIVALAQFVVKFVLNQSTALTS